MFDKILIANRGEIALRVHRACHEMGVRTVAVHSTADANSMHVRLADESVCIGPGPSIGSYLNIPAIVSACEITGANAVHPGYGFLSENAEFASILSAHGITFIGPTAKHIAMMGDKIIAKQTAATYGLPLVPGTDGPVTSLSQALSDANEIGFPVIIKASAGGGGRGMKVVNESSELESQLDLAQQEARAAFGSDVVYIEKYLDKPRHIEVQVLGDGKGGGLHLGERDCSLQRRHQKIWEEARAACLTEEQREHICNLSARFVQVLGYRGAGTIEYLFQDGEFYFLEMNSRLQVEHPVSEMITGFDLVEAQIKIAAGQDFDKRQDEIKFVGHAIECRINAESAVDFTPSPGNLVLYHPAGGPGVRVDSAAYTGYSVPPYYDSMLAKLIIHGKDRPACLARLRRALSEFVVEGVQTTLPLFSELADHPDIIAGNYTIKWLENYLAARNDQGASER